MKLNRILKDKTIGTQKLYTYKEVDTNKPVKEKVEFSFHLVADKPFTYKVYSFKNTTYSKVVKYIDKWFKQAIDKEKGSFEKSIKVLEVK